MNHSFKKPIKTCLLTLTSLLTLAVAQTQAQDTRGDSPNIVTGIVVSNSNVDVGEQFVFKDYKLQISGLHAPHGENLLSFKNVTDVSTNGAAKQFANSSQQALQEFSNNISTKSH